MPGEVGVNGCMSLPQLGKENLLAESTQLLTVIRGSAILCFARTREGLPGRRRSGGLFSFADPTPLCFKLEKVVNEIRLDVQVESSTAFRRIAALDGESSGRLGRQTTCCRG